MFLGSLRTLNVYDVFIYWYMLANGRNDRRFDDAENGISGTADSHLQPGVPPLIQKLCFQSKTLKLSRNPIFPSCS